MAKIISYDKENDILVIHKGFSNGERFKGNIEIGDLILDLSTKMRIRGMELMNAGENLKGFLKLARFKKDVLNHVKDANFNVNIRGNSMSLALILITIKSKKEQEIPAKILVPTSEPVLCLSS